MVAINMKLGNRPMVRKALPVKSKEKIAGYLFILPVMIGFLTFSAIPLISSFVLSLTNYNGINTPSFIGIENYANLVNDPSFLGSLWNTVYFTVGSVPLSVFLSLLAAIALNRKSRMMLIYRTAFFLPVVTSSVAAAEVWKWLFNPSFGLINTILQDLNLYQPPWLTSTTWAMPAVIIVSVWQSIGYNMILYLAGLQGISPTLYEAARIDGANRFAQFRYITIPQLKNTTLFVLVISLIGSFQVFNQVYMMTGGGPDESTNVVVYWIYENAFSFFKQGYASAMAYVLFLIIFVATLVQMKLSKMRENE